MLQFSKWRNQNTFRQRIHCLGSYISSVYGTTLCIPTVFISYTGEALDYKHPFALMVMDEAAQKFVNILIKM
jgi:glutamine synthetase type III